MQPTSRDIHSNRHPAPLPVPLLEALLGPMARRPSTPDAGMDAGTPDADKPFGEVLRMLREVRGLKQRKLADLAGVSESLVRKAELEPDRPIKRSSALLLMKAFDATDAPLNGHEVRLFARAAKLEDILKSVGAITAPLSRIIHVVQGGNVPVAQALRHLCELVPPDHARAYELLADILEAAGASNALKLLEAAAAMTHATPPASADEADVDVVHPPINRGTHTEQRITTYTRPAQSISKPQTKRRSS